MTSPISRGHIHAAARDAGIGVTSGETHAYIHGWAVSLGYASTNDVPAAVLDDMARGIKRDPLVMAAWFDQFAPVEFEDMAPAENAVPDVSLFTDAEWKALHEDADRALAASRARGDGVE